MSIAMQTAGSMTIDQVLLFAGALVGVVTASATALWGMHGALRTIEHNARATIDAEIAKESKLREAFQAEARKVQEDARAALERMARESVSREDLKGMENRLEQQLREMGHGLTALSKDVTKLMTVHEMQASRSRLHGEDTTDKGND